MAGERMPLGKPALPDDVIAKFEKWIATGARFDGPDPALDLADSVAMVKAKNSTHEQLTAERTAAAAKTWKLILPDVEPKVAETKNFLLYGNVSQETLDTVGKAAEAQVPALIKLFKIPADQPLVKGRMTFFVFNKRYDYGEVGAMLERRELPDQWRGHWRYTIVDAQGFIVPPQKDEYSLSSLVAQQIAGVYVASQASVPRWFAEGSARAMAARVDPKDPRVKSWDSKISEALSLGGKPDAFLSGGLPPEEADILAYSFAKMLISKTGAYQQLLAALRAGSPFDQAFAQVYGYTPNQLTTAWAPKAASRRGR
jgi:hypothetical protein